MHRKSIESYENLKNKRLTFEIKLIRITFVKYYMCFFRLIWKIKEIYRLSNWIKREKIIEKIALRREEKDW